MRKLDWLLLLVVGVGTSLWCLGTAREIGPTFDEPFYLQSGLEFWREGKPGQLLQAGTMPLPIEVQTLPLYLVEVVSGQPWVWPDDLPTMLVIARSMTLLFWWLVLIYALLLGHALGGPWAGRLAVLLVGLEPSLLAHAGLATTDLALTACLLVFVYHFRAGRDSGWGFRVGIPTLLFAVAMLAKASTLTFGPLLMIGVELERLARDGTLGRAWVGTWRQRLGNLWQASRPLRWDAVFIGGVGLLLAVLLCGTNGEPLPEIQKNLSKLGDNPIKPYLAAVAEMPVWPNGYYALWFQVKHNLIGHATYLIGYESPRSLWFYFPVLLTIKLTGVVLLLLLLVLLAPGPRLNLALGLAGLLFLFSLNCRVQLGIRFLLPLVAFLLIGLSVRVVAILETLRLGPRRVGIGLMTLLLGWMLLGTARMWPDPLRYVNEIWGGTETGYRMVSDSNYDWGQGLPELAEWQEEQDVPLTIWYMGTDPRWPHLLRFTTANDGLASPKLEGRYLAVGTTVLHGGYTPNPLDRQLKQRLQEKQPIARTRTFLIYSEVDQ